MPEKSPSSNEKALETIKVMNKPFSMSDKFIKLKRDQVPNKISIVLNESARSKGNYLVQATINPNGVSNNKATPQSVTIAGNFISPLEYNMNKNNYNRN